MLEVTIEEAARIARAIAPELGRYAARYDERKYEREIAALVESEVA